MVLVHSDRLVEIIHAFPSVQILVVGDVLLDTYLSCNSLGVANEAPVPLLEIAGQKHAAGGAGNVAANLACLGVRTQLVSPVGDDAESEIVKQLLREAGVCFQPLTVQRPTTHKTRILSGQHYYLRLDEEDSAALNASETTALLGLIEAALESAAALLVSDYDKGTVTETLAKKIEALVHGRRIGILADLKPRNVAHWKSLKVITPNFSEACALLRQLAETDRQPNDPVQLATSISRKMNCDVVLKMSGKGLLAATPAGESFHLNAWCQQPKNVSGGGDTVLAVLGAALACGATLREASVLANLAASIAVSHEETYAVSGEELQGAVRSPGSGFQA
jgi:D-beta-D-heptose 7-phosphate kinase/D-beta-D-heptose 1-phosphate adenosyltransferase